MKEKEKKVKQEKIEEKVMNAGKELEREIKQEVFFNVPNTLTILRLFFAFIAIYMLFSHYSRIIVAIVFGIAAITDYFDGFFARRLKQTTSIGARLDQVVDRIFTTIIVFALVFYFLKYHQEGILMLVLISSREIIGVPGLLIRLVRNKDPYQVKFIGKITTFIQSFALAFIIAGFSFSIYFAIATCIIGIMAGSDYLRDSVK